MLEMECARGRTSTLTNVAAAIAGPMKFVRVTWFTTPIARSIAALSACGGLNVEPRAFCPFNSQKGRTVDTPAHITRVSIPPQAAYEQNHQQTIPLVTKV